MACIMHSGVSRIQRREVLDQSHAKRARKNFGHAPKTLTTPLHVLEDTGSWLTKKAVLGLVAMRKRHLRSNF